MKLGLLIRALIRFWNLIRIVAAVRTLASSASGVPQVLWEAAGLGRAAPQPRTLPIGKQKLLEVCFCIFYFVFPK
jgi:hypothetical protein